MRQLNRAARLILIGAPGVGKGTQTERLLARYPQLSALSSGDLLRTNVRQRTPLGVAAEGLMKSGKLVPDTMMLRLIANELVTRGWLRGSEPRPYSVNSVSAAGAQAAAAAEEPEDTAMWDMEVQIPRVPTSPHELTYSDSPEASFILDGFPRNSEQAEQLDRLIPINMVVHLKTPTTIILDRIANRWVHEPSGRVYNTTFHPPQVPGRDDITGEPLTRRADDNPEVWKTRLEGFEKSVQSLLEHYDKMGVLWSIEGNSSDEISPKLFDEFGGKFAQA
jgi:adenylate kinase